MTHRPDNEIVGDLKVYVARLNQVIDEASNAGLEVEIDVLHVNIVNAARKPIVTMKVKKVLSS